ncbi:hypothetical protein JYQ62_23375 [Nostoc sp. UHCC 0702]|nr:hypothetical protein JYQ62_23375 [Nostoc sp. UHCC 0702]
MLYPSLFYPVVVVIAGDWGLGTLRQAQCIAGDWVKSLFVSRFYHLLMS